MAKRCADWVLLREALVFRAAVPTDIYGGSARAVERGAGRRLLIFNVQRIRFGRRAFSHASTRAQTPPRSPFPLPPSRAPHLSAPATDVRSREKYGALPPRHFRARIHRAHRRAS